jgi:D-alanyl-D-alanine carboxypeptidase
LPRHKNEGWSALKIKVISSAILIPALFVASAIASTGCGSGAKQTKTSFVPEVEARIDDLVNTAMSSGKVPGVIVGVWAPGQGTYVKAFGTANVETGEQMQATDRVRIASITKTFTATVVLQLIDEGKLSLDETIDRYLPQIPGADTITVRQLLSHSSGIYDYEDQAFMKSVVADPLRVWKPQELINLAITHPANFPPGTSCAYSNTNYIALGMIVEQVTGNSLGDEIKNRIITPLDLASTEFPTGPDITGEYSHGYTDLNDPGRLSDITRIDMSWDWAAGAMISNLDDLEIWARAVGTGELISGDLQSQRLHFLDMPEFANMVSYGLGIMKIGPLIGHSGADPGYNSSMYYLPEKDAVIVVLFNYCGAADTVDITSIAIAKAVFPDVSFPF